MSIDFSNNAVNPFGAEAIKPFLKQASFLKVFLINNCGLGIQGVTHIA
jgi:Ran GTPase-activating protein 1